MREILFRGKLPDGEWAEGYVVKGNCTYILTAENIHYMCVSVMGHASVDVLPVIPETVGQYTGLTDKNGKQIFEGDIVRGRDALEKGLVVEGYIDYQYGSFCIVGDLMTHFRWMDYEVEVIGNIHDNPEMIGGKEE